MLIKNISNSPVNINEKLVYPYQSVEIDDINKVKTLLNIGYIELVKTENVELNKEKVLESFFNFHLHKCSKEDLEIIKSFYLKLFPSINKDVKEQMYDASTEEELIEILLNSFYPILIDKNLSESE